MEIKVWGRAEPVLVEEQSTKRIDIFSDCCGEWYVEAREGPAWTWVTVAGPFATEDAAWDALEDLSGIP